MYMAKCVRLCGNLSSYMLYMNWIYLCVLFLAFFPFFPSFGEGRERESRCVWINLIYSSYSFFTSCFLLQHFLHHHESWKPIWSRLSYLQIIFFFFLHALKMKRKYKSINWIQQFISGFIFILYPIMISYFSFLAFFLNDESRCEILWIDPC